MRPIAPTDIHRWRAASANRWAPTVSFEATSAKNNRRIQRAGSDSITCGRGLCPDNSVVSPSRRIPAVMRLQAIRVILR